MLSSLLIPVVVVVVVVVIIIIIITTIIIITKQLGDCERNLLVRTLHAFNLPIKLLSFSRLL